MVSEDLGASVEPTDAKVERRQLALKTSTIEILSLLMVIDPV